MGQQDFAAVSDSEDSARSYDGWSLRDRQDECLAGVAYVIDPKAIHKEALYGTLDPTTREWNDGLFTHILRKIVDDVRGESSKRHWVIFDGDVDPEWVENLNRFVYLRVCVAFSYHSSLVSLMTTSCLLFRTGNA
jgi:hypothetical protein